MRKRRCKAIDDDASLFIASIVLNLRYKNVNRFVIIYSRFDFFDF